MSNNNQVLTQEQMLAEITRLRAENDKLVTKSAGLTMKISEKGCLSVYGMGRFPVSLYQDKWIKLLDHADTIRQFIHDNQSRFPIKPARANAKSDDTDTDTNENVAA